MFIGQKDIVKIFVNPIYTGNQCWQACSALPVCCPSWYGQTGWEAYNAFTQVLTHSKPERGPQNVVDSLLFGQRAQLAQKAFAYVLK